MTGGPFAPPEERAVASRRGGSILLLWTLAGAVNGLAIGLVLHLTRLPGAMATAGLVCAVGGVLAGVVALRLDHAAAEHRVPITGPDGRSRRPLHGRVRLIPLGGALPALVVLMVLGSVTVVSLAPALVFGALVLADAWLMARVWAGHRAVVALQALESGDADAARHAFVALEGGLFTSIAARDAARINLATLALQRVDLPAAMGWFERVSTDRARGRALAGMALVHVLQGQLDRAVEVAGEATRLGGRAVQSEVDLVRVLLVLRTDGAADARALGERLGGVQPPPLLAAILDRLSSEGATHSLDGAHGVSPALLDRMVQRAG